MNWGNSTETLTKNMIMRHYTAIIATVILFILASGIVSNAMDVKTRMRDRLPTVISLKAKGVIGEDSNGFLAFVGSSMEMRNVVMDENRDRQQVYETIAAQQGTTAALVGQRRALQIAEKAAPGEWLQNPSGQWIKK